MLRHAQVRCGDFNGEEVRNLAQLADMVDRCQDKYMKFGLEGGKLVILERLQAIADAPRILQQHAIPFDRSADLRCTLPDPVIEVLPFAVLSSRSALAGTVSAHCNMDTSLVNATF